MNKNMKLLTFLGIISFTFAAYVFTKKHYSEKEESENPQVPYDRRLENLTYPDDVFDFKAYEKVVHDEYLRLQNNKESGATWNYEG